MQDLDAIGLLQEPLRRKLYDYVAAQHHDVSRAEAAEAVGVDRTHAAFHLDKLVDAGLLEVTSRRVNGRTGPGAGRPAKLYRRSPVERQVSLPSRDYRTAAEVLADAAESVRLDQAVYDAATARGRAERAAFAGVEDAEVDELAMLDARGYELYPDGDVVRMANCPFDALSAAQPGLTCGMNLALLEGFLENSDRWSVVLDARAGPGCCTILKSKTNHS